MKGASHIKDLGLAIDWMDPHHCSIQPSSDKDYIGTEYLKEIVKVNSLQNLSQLHLSGFNEKSRTKLDKDCVGYVLTMFGAKLKHLGNFYYWNLKADERWNLANGITTKNCAILFEEHLKSMKDIRVDFHKKYVEDWQTFSCHNPKSLIYQQYNSIRILYDFNDNIADITDTSDQISDSDIDLSFDLDSDDNEGILEENGNPLNLWL